MCVSMTIDSKLTLCPAPPSDGAWPSTDTATISSNSVTTAYRKRKDVDNHDNLTSVVLVLIFTVFISHNKMQA